MRIPWAVIFKTLGIVLLCAVCGAIGAIATTKFGQVANGFSYTEFISIILTAISLLMTVLAFFLAVLGVIGWNSISTRIRERTEEFLNEGFKDGNSLNEMLRKRAEEIMYEGVTPVNAINEADDTVAEATDRPSGS